MFALIIVGEVVEPNFSQWESARLNDVGKRVFASLFEKFEVDFMARK
jgi:hypothetical protein